MTGDVYSRIMNDPMTALAIADSIGDKRRRLAQEDKGYDEWLKWVQQEPAETQRLQEVETATGQPYITIESALRGGRWTVPMPETENYEHQAMTTLGKALERLWGRKALRGGGF